MRVVVVLFSLALVVGCSMNRSAHADSSRGPISVRYLVSHKLAGLDPSTTTIRLVDGVNPGSLESSIILDGAKELLQDQRYSIVDQGATIDLIVYYASDTGRTIERNVPIYGHSVSQGDMVSADGKSRMGLIAQNSSTVGVVGMESVQSQIYQKEFMVLGFYPADVTRKDTLYKATMMSVDARWDYLSIAKCAFSSTLSSFPGKRMSSGDVIVGGACLSLD